MDELQQAKNQLLGKTLTRLFYTQQEGPHDLMPGIAPAYYFHSVMEINHSTLLRFGNNFLSPWNNLEPLLELSNQNWHLPYNLEFKDQIVTDIICDEYGNWTFCLENGTTIAHTYDFGDQLSIENSQIPPLPKQEVILNRKTNQTKTGWLKKLLNLFR